MIDAIASDTGADLTVNTENGKLTVDKETLDQLSKDAKGLSVRIVITKVKEPTAEQQKLAGDNVQPYILTVMSGDQAISGFAGKITQKNVKVTVTMNKKTASDIKVLKKLGYTVKYSVVI